MATASVIFSKFAGGHQTISSSFASQDVASGSVSTACPTSYNLCIVIPQDGNVWAAVSSGTPDASTNPRVPLTANVPYTFFVKPGVKVAILNRP